MKITNATKAALVPLILGDNNEIWKYRTGRELVKLFQDNGFRDDFYDPENGGLPKLGNGKLNTSRKTYTGNRLLHINEENLKNIIEQILTDATDKDKALEEINTILQHDNIQLDFDGEQLFWEGMAAKKIIKNEASFIENESKIIHAINQAQVSILIAMAWFTNDSIIKALEKKRLEGIQIEIVIFKDGVNAKYGVDLSNFDYKEIRGTRGGTMHNKFCVIDNQKVITGSYNWSDNAENKNDENIIITNDEKTATKYSTEFRKLKPLI